MKTNFIPTNEYYTRILETKDAAARRQLYLDLLVQPWKPMMDMVAGHMAGSGSDDALAGARMWGWLLPDQTGEIAGLLKKLEEANAWELGGEALVRAAGRFESYAARIPFDEITGWLALSDPHRSNPFERGYTGATDWFRPWFIGQFWELNDDNLPRLPGLVAHEMHHLIRLQAFPWDLQRTSVADYIVIEGTAEAFAASLFGEDKIGYYITEFEPQEFETARRIVGEGLAKTGFNVIRGYLFGDALAEQARFDPVGGMPLYGGYTIGYHVVKAFLERTGCSIEETTFLPAGQIIEESGFFA